MMVTTHLLAGMALAAVATVLAPDLAPAALLGGVIGGVFPDLDLYAGHRKSLHYPVYYPVGAGLALVAAAAAPNLVTTAVAFGLLGAALHSWMDVLGGGLELKPWEGTSDRGVYDHVRGRWIPPRRWIRFDGAPEDLGLAVLLGLPVLTAFPSTVDLVVLAVLVVSAGYAAIRKPIVSVAERYIPRLPRGVLTYVPDRFIEDFRAG